MTYRMCQEHAAGAGSVRICRVLLVVAAATNRGQQV